MDEEFYNSRDYNYFLCTVQRYCNHYFTDVIITGTADKIAIVWHLNLGTVSILVGPLQKIGKHGDGNNARSS